MTVEEIAECAEISKQSGPQIKATNIDEEHLKTLIPEDKLEEFFRGGDGVVPEQVEVDSASPEIKNLPESVDLRKWASRIDDQGSEGLCTSFASLAYLSLKIAKETGVRTDLSEYFHWYNYAEYNSWSAAQALCRFWQGEERFWPNHARQGLAGWDESRIATLASPRILQSLAEVRAHLASGEPVLLSVGLDTRYWTSPIVYGDRGEQRGGHAILLCGYYTIPSLPAHQRRVYVCQNSWGENYGDRGYSLLTEDYFTNNRFWVQFIGMNKEVIWRPGKKPGGDILPTSLDLKAQVFKKYSYSQEGSPEHGAYGISVTGKDKDKIKTVTFTPNPALPSWEEPSEVKLTVGTYAQSGYSLGKAEVTLLDGKKLTLEAQVP